MSYFLDGITNGHAFEYTAGDSEAQGMLQSMRSQRVGYNWATEQQLCSLKFVLSGRRGGKYVPGEQKE